MIGLIETTSATPPTGDDLPKRVEAVFRANGALQKALGLEHRPQQADMALACAAAMVDAEALLFEAGTGVGKSLAYLIPGIIRAVDTGHPLVISSHTIALQEQLFKKDLEICSDLFEKCPELERYARFSATVMVGKGNYLCGTRFANVLREARNPHQAELFENDEREQLNGIEQWMRDGGNGTRQELSPEPGFELWEKINADSSVCSRKNCSPANCPHQAAKARIQEADVIIVNHSLLFSLLNAGMGPRASEPGVLFPGDILVLDEAHRVPAIATDHLGLHLTCFAVHRTLLALNNKKKNKGFLLRFKNHGDTAAVDEAIDANREFFGYIDQEVLRSRTLLRVTEAGLCSNILDEPLAKIANRLRAHLNREDDENLRLEIEDHQRRIAGYRRALADFLEQESEDFVYWLERTGRGGKIIALRNAPLDVAPHLRRALFSKNSPVVLTSATLSDGQTMDAFRNRVGADAARDGIRRSPFDYDNHCRIAIAKDAPEPNAKAGALDLDYLAETIFWSASRCPGGTLVLCTSYSDLRALYQRLTGPLRSEGRTLLGQGIDFNRMELVRRFREDGAAVLLGTDSFWTGVDIPGPALSQVIVTRLPFENPSHPVLQARTERIRDLGGNPFVELTLADALIKFRQGIGRLIRSADDCGTLLLLDSRILRRPYGKSFLAALPHTHYTVFERANRESAINHHW